MTIDEVTLSIEQAAQLLRQAKHVVALTGAGISTPSGIPDFRSPTSGLWKDVDPFEVASIFGFKQNPQAFYDWVRPLTRTILEAHPNAAHRALMQLESLGHLKSIITQNIDMLHSKAGSSHVLEIHGHLREGTCVHCFTVYPAQALLETCLETGEIPRCEKCGNVIKPNVVLFGEQLPIRELQASKQAARECDVMLVVGTSLEVAPASDLPILAHRTGSKLIIINLSTTPADPYAQIVIRGNAADILPQIVQRLEMLL